MDPENIDGRYDNESDENRWDVYDREGEKCPHCGTRIRRVSHSGRSTYYCPRCQRR